MKYNYHAHTYRCKHAGGSEREYIEEAIRGGYEVFGFSDHAPMPFPKEYIPPTRMDMNELEGYVDTVLSLKKEYKDDIDIRLGLETEYYPAYWEGFLKEIGNYPIEYLILGQHYLGNEVGSKWCGLPTEEAHDLKTYTDQVIEALDKYDFLYLAHPDLINFTGDKDLYKKEMRRLIKECVKRNVLLEINFLGILTKRNYPDPVFWEMAGQEGAKTVFGVDCHETDQVFQPETEKKAMEMVRRFGLNLQADVE